LAGFTDRCRGYDWSVSEVDDSAAKAGTQKTKRESLLEFFGTLPGIITAVAALITAVGGLIIGLGSGDDDPAAPSVPPVGSVSPTVPPSTSAPPSTTPTPEASEPPTSEPTQPTVIPSPSRKTQATKLGTPTRVVKLSVKAGDYVQPVVWTVSNSARSFSDILIRSDPAANRMTFRVGSLGKVFFAATEEVSSNACRASLAVRKDQSMRVGESDQGTWTCMLVDTTVGATRLDRIDTILGTASITIILW
jgi:pyruvate/2-oxoglutarate dehydrogenase complex dihydrolipoamide acyltransferase (E2) component